VGRMRICLRVRWPGSAGSGDGMRVKTADRFRG
jgi:hypothetical protein